MIKPWSPILINTCLTPSPTNSHLPAAIKTAWRPSLCEGDGDGLSTSWGESRITSLAQPFTGNLKGSARGEDQETPGAEMWRHHRSRSWPRTDRRGDPSLPSYAPHGIMGMSEWVGTGLATVNITHYFTLQLREFAEGKGWVHIYEKDWALVESFIRFNPYMVP